MNLAFLVISMWVLVRLGAPWWLYIFWGIGLACFLSGITKGE